MTDLNKLKKILGKTFKGFYIERQAVKEGFIWRDITIVWSDQATRNPYSISIYNIVGEHGIGYIGWLKECQRLNLPTIIAKYPDALATILRVYSRVPNDDVKYFINKISNLKN